MESWHVSLCIRFWWPLFWLKVCKLSVSAQYCSFLLFVQQALSWPGVFTHNLLCSIVPVYQDVYWCPFVRIFAKLCHDPTASSDGATVTGCRMADSTVPLSQHTTWYQLWPRLCVNTRGPRLHKVSIRVLHTFQFYFLEPYGFNIHSTILVYLAFDS